MYFKMITIKIIKHYFILINCIFNPIFSKELISYITQLSNYILIIHYKVL